MWSVDPLLHRPTPTDSRAGFVPERLPLRRRPREEEIAQLRVQASVDLGIAVALEVEELRRPLAGQAGRAGEPGEVARARSVELDVLAVGAAETPGAAAVDAGGRTPATLFEISAGVPNESEHRIEKRHFDSLAVAAALAGDERHDDTGRPEEGAEVRCERQGR